MAIKVNLATLRKGDYGQAATYAMRNYRLYRRRAAGHYQSSQRLHWYRVARAWRKVHHACCLLQLKAGWALVRDLSGIQHVDEKWLSKWN